MRWQLRGRYFRGPGSFVFEAGDKQFPVEIDKDGYFDAPLGGFPYGAFARLQKPKAGHLDWLFQLAEKIGIGVGA